MPSKCRDPGRPAGRFSSGPSGPITRRTGEPSERVHRTQAFAGCRVRRGWLLLGHGEHRIWTGHVIRGTRPARRPQAARILVAGSRILHVPRFLVRIGLPHRRPTIIHQPTDAPETAAVQVLIVHKVVIIRRFWPARLVRPPPKVFRHLFKTRFYILHQHVYIMCVCVCV